KLEHVAFGSVLRKRPDGKVEMFKTREGEVVELMAVLDEGVGRAARAYEEHRAERLARGEEVPELSEQEKRDVAEAVGVGALKYADLCQNRTSDYLFDWDKMLALEGNTSVYMQYAYVRPQGIFRKGEIDVQALRAAPPLPVFERPEERALALQLLRFEDTLQTAAAEYKPSAITAYLWDLAKTSSAFYTHCPVLRAARRDLRQRRLLRCALTARVIRRGLPLVAIRTVERMCPWRPIFHRPMTNRPPRPLTSPSPPRNCARPASRCPAGPSPTP